VANLFQFYERVYPRLVVDLRIPFQFTPLRPGETITTPQPELFQRHDETIVHEAIREAFVNALIHADFRGQGGVIIERFRDRLEFSNPGTLLLGIEQVLKGGVSECRNKTLQTMFAMLGYGEKAGSGIDKIRQGWASQKWRWPLIQEQHRPDRVRLTLPMVSLLPEESLTRLRTVLGGSMSELDGREVQALVTADVEGSVSNQRLQQFCADHTADITRLLQNLVAKGLLEKDGYGRWASYRLSGHLAKSRHGEGTPDTNSRHGEATPDTNSRHGEGTPDTTASGTPENPENDPALLAIAEPARKRQQLKPEVMRPIIRALCRGRFLTFRQLATLLNREPNGLQRWTLRPMAQEKQLVLAYPETPNHPKQAYQTNPDWRES
jgi:ATP-dependent DNA helicase RecG